MEFKVEAVKWHRMNRENCSFMTWTYSVDRKRIRKWEKAYDKLLPLGCGKTKKKRKLHVHEGLLISMLSDLSRHKI